MTMSQWVQLNAFMADRKWSRGSGQQTAEIQTMLGTEFLAMQIPTREVLMSEHNNPLFYAQSLNQILAWRGVGKTLFALGLAGAMTAGESILGFKAARPVRVMYVDGELPLAQLQERVAQQVKRPENFFPVNRLSAGTL